MTNTYKQYSKIEVYVTLYDKDTNSEYILDTNGNKIILKTWENVTINDDYDIVVDITSYT